VRRNLDKQASLDQFSSLLQNATGYKLQLTCWSTKDVEASDKNTVRTS